LDEVVFDVYDPPVITVTFDELPVFPPVVMIVVVVVVTVLFSDVDGTPTWICV
jgi:hypothetical protein